MTTVARTASRLAKKLTRRVRNLEAKRIRAAQRQLELIELGKTVISTEVPTGETDADGKEITETVLSFPKPVKLPTFNISATVFVSEKSRKNHGLTMRNRPSNKELHAQAIVEDASRTFTKECDKAMGVPAVNGEPISQL